MIKINNLEIIYPLHPIMPDHDISEIDFLPNLEDEVPIFTCNNRIVYKVRKIAYEPPNKVYYLIYANNLPKPKEGNEDFYEKIKAPILCETLVDETLFEVKLEQISENGDNKIISLMMPKLPQRADYILQKENMRYIVFEVFDDKDKLRKIKFKKTFNSIIDVFELKYRK